MPVFWAVTTEPFFCKSWSQVHRSDLWVKLKLLICRINTASDGLGSGNHRAVLADHGEVGRGHNGRGLVGSVRHRNIGPVYTAGSGIVDFGGDETLFAVFHKRGHGKSDVGSGAAGIRSGKDRAGAIAFVGGSIGLAATVSR